jgi:toxin ParE1/3/4
MILRFRPEAENDLINIGAYIERDDPNAAASFVRTLREKCGSLLANPEIGRSRPELITDLRSFPVGQYVIFYRPRQEILEIVRVLHGARDIDALFEIE